MDTTGNTNSNLVPIPEEVPLALVPHVSCAFPNENGVFTGSEMNPEVVEHVRHGFHVENTSTTQVMGTDVDMVAQIPSFVVCDKVENSQSSSPNGDSQGDTILQEFSPLEKNIGNLTNPPHGHTITNLTHVDERIYGNQETAGSFPGNSGILISTQNALGNLGPEPTPSLNPLLGMVPVAPGFLSNEDEI